MVSKFTEHIPLKDVSLEEDLEEFKQEVWEEENFDSYEDYEFYYCNLVDDLRDDSRRKTRKVRDIWNKAEKKLEQVGPETRQSVSRTDVHLVPQAIEEAVSLAVESLPRPKVENRGQHDEQFAAMLNQAMDQEMEANAFDSHVIPKVVYHMKLFALGVIQCTWDMDMPQLFGEKPGRNVLRCQDPRNFNFDPFATGYRREDGRYLIVDRVMDLSLLRAKYPDKKIKPEDNFSKPKSDKYNEVQEMLDMENREYQLGSRDRVMVKELWLNSEERIKRRARHEDGSYKKDVTGAPVYEVVKKYPHGRLIIVANKTLLCDMPNPYAHGQYPYIFFPAKLSNRLFTVGDVDALIKLEEKLNRLHKDAIRNLRVNMNSPWIIDRHAFDSPKKFNLLTNDPGMILPVANGARVERLTSPELPQSLFIFMDYLKKTFDDVLGVQGIQRGQLEKGAQLSADAVTQLQASATARLKFKSSLMENALKQLGHVLQWNIRQFYDTGMEIQVPVPGTDKTEAVEWSAGAAQAKYHIQIEAGSGLPGAKEAGANLMRQLYKDDLISREYALRGMKLPGVEKEIANIQKKEDEWLAKGMEGKLKGMHGGGKK